MISLFFAAVDVPATASLVGEKHQQGLFQQDQNNPNRCRNSLNEEDLFRSRKSAI
jgi:hypothetical protein